MMIKEQHIELTICGPFAAGKILNLPEREIHRTRAQRMEKAVRTHVGTFKHNDGVNKLQAEFSRNFQAFMEGVL